MGCEVSIGTGNWELWSILGSLESEEVSDPGEGAGKGRVRQTQPPVITVMAQSGLMAAVGRVLLKIIPSTPALGPRSPTK